MKIEPRSRSSSPSTRTDTRPPQRAPERVPTGHSGASSFDPRPSPSRELAERLAGEPAPRPQVASQDLARLMPPAHSVSVTGPEHLSSFDFQGTRAPADRYQVDLGNGRTVPVVVGQGAVEPGMHQARLEDVARALSRLPPEALAGINQVNVSPFRNPQDAEWAVVNNNPGFRSDMTNGAAGVVTVYPRGTPASDAQMAASMLHESAHAWSAREWGADLNGTRWRAWSAAGAADGRVASDYALSNAREDLSETAAVYLASRGTPAFDTYRAQFPNRFAILDAQFGGRS